MECIKVYYAKYYYCDEAVVPAGEFRFCHETKRTNSRIQSCSFSSVAIRLVNHGSNVEN